MTQAPEDRVEYLAIGDTPEARAIRTLLNQRDILVRALRVIQRDKPSGGTGTFSAGENWYAKRARTTLESLSLLDQEAGDG